MSEIEARQGGTGEEGVRTHDVDGAGVVLVVLLERFLGVVLLGLGEDGQLLLGSHGARSDKKRRAGLEFTQ